MAKITLKELASEVLRVFVIEARKGCTDSTIEGIYADWQNGNGEDIGDDIIALLKQCEAIAGTVPEPIYENE